jgi:hypothetical protein
VQPLTDLSLTASLPTFSSTANHGNPQRLNIRRVTSFTFKFSGVGARKTVEPLYVQAIPHESTNHR